jgi:LptD protein
LELKNFCKNKINSALKAKLIYFFILFMSLATTINAQVPDSILKKSNRPVNPPSFLPDSIAKRMAFEKKDTPNVVNTTIIYSKDSLDVPVEYGSKDSMIFDNVNNLVHLYGAAYVNYQKLKLTAAYITIDLKNNIATAKPLPDSVGRMKGLPNFKDETQDFTAGEMRYNFRTQKGIVKDVTTKYNDAYVHGGLSKFVSSKGSKDSTTKIDDTAYSTDAIFTTCNADHPHFGIHSQKQKVIPNKLIVVGPSNLTIGDIPTPLWLPFAAFPLSAGKRTGLIFPRDYEYNQTFGFGLRNMGWYFPLSDNYDLTMQGDVYVRGTFGVRANSNYVKTYKYSGRAEIGFNSIISEDDKANLSRSPSWNISWSHTQDQRANPLFSFNANVNMQGSKSKTYSNYRSTTYNDFKNATTSQISSSIGFTQTFPGKPYSLTGGLNHSQNNATRDATIEPLNLDFRVQTIFPFKNNKRIGNEKWYEKVSLQYSANMRNRLQTKDSLLLNKKAWDDLQSGIKHDLSSSFNFTFLKYFNQSFSVNYSESWYSSQYRRSFNRDSITIRKDTLYNPLDSTDFTIRRDTTQWGKVDTMKKTGFYRLPQYSMGTNISTRIFGTIQFKKGKIRGIRHTLTPNVGFSYSPNYTRYEDSVYTDARNPFRQVYNLYQNAIFGAPSSGSTQAALTYSLTNLFELKTFNKKDSTFKKSKLLENVSIAGSYNFIADSFRFSQIAMGTGTNLFKGLTTLSVNALFDPYGKDSKGNRVKEFALKRNGKLLNLVNASLNLNTGLSIGDIKRVFKSENEGSETSSSSTPTIKKAKGKPSEESLTDMLESFRLSHNFSVSRTSFGGRDTTIFSNALYTSGNIPLTKKWRITVGNIGYDFSSKRMTYPDFGFYRDLHCWEMGMNWQPTRGTYSFFLRVKPGTLDFLKVPYNKNIGDVFNR